MIIQSLLDTDFYKLTMMQTVLHQFPSAMVEYRFKCRTPGVDFRPLIPAIREQVAALCQLRFTQEELDYLRDIPFFKTDFVEFLRIFQLSDRFIEYQEDPEFDVIIRGPWLHTILFEIPLLAIISELYQKGKHPVPDYPEARQRLSDKLAYLKKNEPTQTFRFSEFGTRRRFSRMWHEELIGLLLKEVPEYLSGTSNVMFAKQFGIKAIGTMAHEYLQACQAVGPRLIHSQRYAFETWAQEYRGALGIALTDVFTLDVFLKDFDLYFCKLFDGVRHDSGDPYVWGERMVAHYQKHRIDPKTKTLVFSDALTIQSALDIFNHFKSITHPVFGIGTNLTNDLGYAGLQIVIKMVECNGQPVAKLSDSPDKTMCRDPSYLTYLRSLMGS